MAVFSFKRAVPNKPNADIGAAGAAGDPYVGNFMTYTADFTRQQAMQIPTVSRARDLCKYGVILASEKRVTYGYMVSRRSGMKVFKLTDKVSLAYAGLVSDMQALSREAQAYANLYALENNRPISVKSMAKLISNMLFQRRLFPLLMETLVGGVDDDGPNLYSMDPVGSLIPDDFITAGSGAPIAMGVIEAEYKKEMSLETGKELALKALNVPPEGAT